VSDKRLGVYGGTFDPIHIGHIEIARLVVRQFALDELLIIPAYRPPHKTHDEISEARHRYTMAALAFKDETRIQVSKMEIEAPERPYTIQTMERLRGEYGEATRLFFVMGADSFAEITSWREYRRLLTITNLIVITRPGNQLSLTHLDEELRAKVIDLRGPADPGTNRVQTTDNCLIYLTDVVNRAVSSTEIRRRVRHQESLAGLTTPEVIDYIEKHKLYR
jgi:nicotinate-nucleotide adenylyltransferase